MLLDPLDWLLFTLIAEKLAAAYCRLKAGDEHAYELLKFCIYVKLAIEIGISLNNVNITNCLNTKITNNCYTSLQYYSDKGTKI